MSELSVHEFLDPYCIEVQSHPHLSLAHQQLKNIYQLIKSDPELERRFILSHSGYVIDSVNWDFITRHFPWLEEFRKTYTLEKHILYLSTPISAPHSHMRKWPSSFCFPIIGTNQDTHTYWIEPTSNLENHLVYRHEVPAPQEKADFKTYSDPSVFPEWSEGKKVTYPYSEYNGPYRVLKTHCILDHPVIFNGNQWHYVISNLKEFDRHSRRCVNWAAHEHWEPFVRKVWSNY